MPYTVNAFTFDEKNKKANFQVVNERGEFVVGNVSVEITGADTVDHVKKLAFARLETMFPEALAACKQSLQG